MNAQTTQTFDVSPSGLSTRRVYKLTDSGLRIDTFYRGTGAKDAESVMLAEGDAFELPKLSWLDHEPRKIIFRVFIEGVLIAIGTQRRGRKLKLRPCRGVA